MKNSPLPHPNIEAQEVQNELQEIKDVNQGNTTIPLHLSSVVSFNDYTDDNLTRYISVKKFNNQQQIATPFFKLISTILPVIQKDEFNT